MNEPVHDPVRDADRDVSPRTLVFGTRGLLVADVIDELRRHEQVVRVLVAGDDPHPSGIEVMTSDLGAADDLSVALRDVDSVVAIFDLAPDAAAWDAPLAALRALGDRAGPGVHVVLAIHARLDAAERSIRMSGLAYTIIRCPHLTDAPQMPTGLRLRQGGARDGEVARRDVAEACVQALRHPAAIGKTFTLVSDAAAARPAWDWTFALLAADQKPAC